jgi:hypothetical protein
MAPDAFSHIAPFAWTVPSLAENKKPSDIGNLSQTGNQ